ncbi:MAG: L,D-transpeptidase [Pseudomonadota bacterium]
MKRFLLAAVAGLAATLLISTPSDARIEIDPVSGRAMEQLNTGRGGYSPIPRQVVEYETRHRAGTIIIDTEERRLYLVMEDGKALKYGVGVGRPGFEWAGTHRVTRMAEWPGWTPPAAMRRRQPGLPAFVPGGPNNPLGARALYLGSTLYRIHGSNEPWSIGQAVSSGCIRMTNEDVMDLYNRVRVGAKVVVVR